jgi:hypothetical protein
MEDLKKLDDEIVKAAVAWCEEFAPNKPHASYSPETNALLKAIYNKKAAEAPKPLSAEEAKEIVIKGTKSIKTTLVQDFQAVLDADRASILKVLIHRIGASEPCARGANERDWIDGIIRETLSTREG